MLIAFFRISRWRLRYSFSFCRRRISANICSRSSLPSIDLGRRLLSQIRLFPKIQTVFAAAQLSSHLSLRLATVDYHFHCLAPKSLFIENVLSCCFHGILSFILSSRVRQIGGGSGVTSHQYRSCREGERDQIRHD